MIDRKREIMETAMKCFAAKGYHATSIQEIADSLGMAKGSLYFYFKSKEDILVSICKYYCEQYVKEVLAVAEDRGVPPRDRLLRQAQGRFEQFVRHRDFITLFMKERFEVNEDIHRLFHTVRLQSLSVNQQCLVELYGEAVSPYSFDAATMFGALIDGYIGCIVLDRMAFDAAEIAAYLVARLDDLVRGLLADSPKPILQAERMSGYVSELLKSGPQTERLAELRALRDTIDMLTLEPSVREELESTLLFLEAELEKPEPQPVLIKGMIALLKSMRVAELRKPIAKLESSL